jgi:DNA-binding CsgD family transcriptional regulator
MKKLPLQPKSSSKRFTKRPYNIDVESLLWLPTGRGVFWKDTAGYYLDGNDTSAEYLHLSSRHAIVGLSDYDLTLVTTEADAIREEDKRIINTGKCMQFYHTLSTPHGEKLYVQSFKVPLFDANNMIVGICGVNSVLDSEHLEDVWSPLNEAGVPKKDLHAARKSLLTYRQIECLKYLVQGMTLKQIGNVLCLSPKTIEHYLEIVKNKLNCHTRAELIVKAIRLGLIED